jgi:hypothetical protein
MTALSRSSHRAHDPAIADSALLLIGPTAFRNWLAREVEHYFGAAKGVGRSRLRRRFPELGFNGAKEQPGLARTAAQDYGVLDAPE